LPRPHVQGGRSSGAIRQGDWKLIEFYDTGELELYNLSDDIGESRNLAATLPAKTAEMKERLAAWREEEGIELPEYARDYSPGKFFWDPTVRWVLSNVIYRF
jgi:arylsulfatase A-like enzyme